MKRNTVIILVLLSLFLGCDLSLRLVDGDEFYGNDNEELDDDINPGVEAPEKIRLLAYSSALYYSKNSVAYEWGGDDYIEPSRGVDCSGLIINNYIYAIKGTSFDLPFTDSTAHDIFHKYSNSVSSPEKGDLVFWKNSEGRIYHIALFEKEIGDMIYFIDSTENNYINGVTYRSVKKSGIYGFKRMLLTAPGK